MDVADIRSELFWRHVLKQSPNECWLWDGATRNGYGAFGVKGATQYAHRIAYILSRGDIPEGMLLRHSCDNRRCCNPAHLEPGTDWDNAKDAKQRGRTKPGVRRPSAKLSTRAVNRLEYLASLGVRPGELAKIFDVSSNTVDNILHGYSYVDDAQPDVDFQRYTADIAAALESLAATQRVVSGQFSEEALQPTRENIVMYFLALIDEITELLHELNWKQWANEKVVDRQRVADEFADVLAFLGVITLYIFQMGVTAEDLSRAYSHKSIVNILRFTGHVEGYDAVHVEEEQAE